MEQSSGGESRGCSVASTIDLPTLRYELILNLANISENSWKFTVGCLPRRINSVICENATLCLSSVYLYTCVKSWYIIPFRSNNNIQTEQRTGLERHGGAVWSLVKCTWIAAVDGSGSLLVNSDISYSRAILVSWIRLDIQNTVQCPYLTNLKVVISCKAEIDSRSVA